LGHNLPDHLGLLRRRQRGHGGGTTNGEKSWKRKKTFPSATDDLAGISCVDPAHCWVLVEVGPVVATTDGGRTWVTESPPGSPDLQGISCSTNNDFTAVGEDQLTDEDLGVVVSTTDGGSTWSPGTLSGQAKQLWDISCSTTTRCWASIDTTPGAAVVTTADGGRHWSTQTLPDATATLEDISCPTSINCFAVGTTSGGASALLATSDGGATWISQTDPAGVEGLDGVISCPTASDCVALIAVGEGIGTGAIATTDGGATWQTQSLGIGGDPGVTDLACPTPSFCMVATISPNPHCLGTVAVTTDGGTTWQTEGGAAGGRLRLRLVPDGFGLLRPGHRIQRNDRRGHGGRHHRRRDDVDAGVPSGPVTSG
jgi:photosystem II stability/assembly factor-like uncharacterized protein